MGDEHDSWFKPFGFDPVKFASDTFEAAKKEVKKDADAVMAFGGQVVQDAGNLIKKAEGAVASAGKTLTNPTPAAGKSGAPKGGLSLGGTVGRGGKNDPNDVQAVQAALGLASSGQCDSGTIDAIMAFQKKLGQAKPDGRVDPGGPTSRSLAAGGKAAPAVY